ncbi:DUF4400 domain-containing protein [Duodenibacillus massiliensis]|uniref:DUF4400 domain-containing protein n=1 Tax=Duodenibacillus massiliensis TaxID=1852381 RepID=UPI0023A7E25D|nr:DUF4400 domain-containing protein [Duodenibacillus massiliensis]
MKSKDSTGSLVFKSWLLIFAVSILFGATAYWSGEEVAGIAKAEVEAAYALFGEWPLALASRWWDELQLNALQDACIQAVFFDYRENDPLRELGEQADRFLAGCVINGFGLVYVWFVRLAVVLRWGCFCLPLAVAVLIVGLLQREFNRQMFTFTSPYRIASKVALLKWTAIAAVVLLLCPVKLPLYGVMAVVCVLAVLPGWLVAGLQKEL